jgi:hypothetical protein
MVSEKEDFEQSAVSIDRFTHSILWIRDQKVMLSTVLADMYDVETRALIQAVKRNIQRFPKDFMFQLTRDEVEVLKSQNVISKTPGRGGAHRSLPYAFTEQGLAMLSSVLKSERAVAINIEIMRTFVRMRKLAFSNEELARKIDELDRRVSKHDKAIAEIIEAFRQLMAPPSPKETRPIGFASWADE